MSRDKTNRIFEDRGTCCPMQERMIDVTLYDSFGKKVKITFKDGGVMQGLVDWVEGSNDSGDGLDHASIGKVAFTEGDIQSIEEIDKPE